MRIVKERSMTLHLQQFDDAQAASLYPSSLNRSLMLSFFFLLFVAFFASISAHVDRCASCFPLPIQGIGRRGDLEKIVEQRRRLLTVLPHCFAGRR
jgi:hypothetical protein